MRIVFIGQAPFGAETLKALIDQGEEIVGVVTVPEAPQQKHANPVKQCAAEHDIPILQSNRLKSAEARAWVCGLQPDLLVLAFVTAFIPKEMIDCATHGGINYHPSLLPKYRGGSAINWAIISGEQETGVSIHYIDEGVDTGPVLLQEKVAIEPDDTVKSVYFGKLYPLGIKMMAEAVRLIRQGRGNATAQDEAAASFQPVISTSDTVIDWNQPTSTVYNLIRGANPAPGAVTSLHGRSCKIFDARRAEGSGRPGEVIDISSETFTVSTADGAIVVQTVQPEGRRKGPASAFAEQEKLAIGDVFDA